MSNRWIPAFLAIALLCGLLLLVVQIAGKREGPPTDETTTPAAAEHADFSVPPVVSAGPHEPTREPPGKEVPQTSAQALRQTVAVGTGVGSVAVTGDAERTVYAGRVIDHTTGLPIAGARVRATAYRGEEATEFAGTPALTAVAAVTDDDGKIWLAPAFTDDPQVRLHVQVQASAYAPTTTIVSRRDAPFAGWREPEIALRPQLLPATIRILGPDGEPLLRGVPVRVATREDGFSFLDAPVVEVSTSPPLDWSVPGRLVRPLRPRIVFTSSGGNLHLPWSPYAVDLELLDGTHYLSLIDPETHLHHAGRIRTHVAGQTLQALAGIPVTQQLFDLDGYPVASTEIEVTLEGMPSVRLRTDEEGTFSLGVLPSPRLEVPVSLVHPRRGTLTVVAAEFANRSVPISLPTTDAVLTLPWRPASLLRLRSVAVLDDGEIASLPPHGFGVSADLTVTRQAVDGEIALRGVLSPRTEHLEFQIRGFLPRTVALPAAAREVVIEDVLFEPGWQRDFLVTGAPPGRGLWLMVTLDRQATGRLPRKQTYPVEAEGQVHVGGLEFGTYTASVEGPGIESVSVPFDVTQEFDPTPIEVPVSLSAEERVVVRGSVTGRSAGAGQLQTTIQTVERYRVDWQEDWLTFPPYSAAGPGAAFGSTRLLEGVTGVQVVVLEPGGKKAAAVFLQRVPGEPPVFECGEMLLRPTPRAEVSFFVRGLGRVLPPLRAAVRAPSGLEELVRLGVRNGNLVIDNLPAVPFQLDWLSEDDSRESVTLDAGSGTRVTRFEVERAALAQELIAIRVVDSSGRPLQHAQIHPEAPPTDWGFDPEPGIHLAEIWTRRENHFTVTATGLLPAFVTTPAGSVIPTEVRLYPPIPVRGRILDTDGTLVDGEVSIQWEARKPSAIEHGEPLVVRARRGVFEAEFPSLPLIYTFRLLDSPATAVVALTATPTRDHFDVGTLRLGESRSVRGRVVLPDGSPAARAGVGLMQRSAAVRLPLTETRAITEARYSTVTDSGGHFALDGLPQDVELGLTLVARLDGYGDALEDPFDANTESHGLTLLPSASLSLEVGYADGTVREDYRFALEYQPDPADPESRIDLGEIRPHLYGVQRFHGIEPGLYRVRWGLRQAYEPIPGLWEEVLVEPGVETRLDLQLEGRVLTGTARLNGALLESGWFLLTTDPAASGSTRVGRVVDGKYFLIDPPESFRGYGALIPERTPLPLQNVARGEALPQLISRYGSAARRGTLHFGYEAYSLTFQFAEDFLSRHPGATMSYRTYEWDGNRYRASDSREPIDEPTVHFHLLPAGGHRFTVRGADGSLLHNRLLNLQQDLVLYLR